MHPLLSLSGSKCGAFALDQDFKLGMVICFKNQRGTRAAHPTFRPSAISTAIH